jgi:voltage-gated potassium channel
MVIGLARLRHLAPEHGHHFSLPAVLWILVRVVYGLLLLHLLQILVWAACFQVLGCFPDFATSFYYSATSYSTVGFGDVHPPEQWRILGAIEAVTGILMFGWSTGVLFAVVHWLLGRFTRKHPDKHHD